MNKIPITVKGAEKLREELVNLKNVVRPRITAAIAEARAHGDLKENAGTMPPANSKASPRDGSRKSRRNCPIARSST